MISTQALTPVWERSYEGLAVFSVLCGSCIGSLLSLSATLVVDVREVSDPDALARASGLICAFLGVGGTLAAVAGESGGGLGGRGGGGEGAAAARP